MPIEVVQSIEASVAEVIAGCRAVAEAHNWKIIGTRSAPDGLAFKTPMSWAALGGNHIDVSIQPQGRFTLMTVWAQSAALVNIDPTRQAARLARQFASDVLQELESGHSQR